MAKAQGLVCAFVFHGFFSGRPAARKAANSSGEDPGEWRIMRLAIGQLGFAIFGWVFEDVAQTWNEIRRQNLMAAKGDEALDDDADGDDAAKGERIHEKSAF